MVTLPVVTLPIVAHDVPYTCTRCGDCCRRPWTVGVDAVELERYRAIDWSTHDPRLAERILFNPTANGRAHTIAREADGACVFLAADGLCTIHRVLGLEQKPKTCRTFPYNFIETPDDVRVSLSWATRGRDADPPDPREQEELAATYARDRRANAVFTVEDRARVALVDLFRRFVRDADAGADACLLSIKRAVDLIAKKQLDPADLSAVESALEGPVRGNNAVISRTPRPLLTGALLALPIALASPVRKARDATNIFTRIARALASDRFAPPHLARDISLDALRKISFARDRKLWASFLSDLLLDGLMVEPKDLSRYLARVITTYVTARWLAKQACATRGATVVGEEDVRYACGEAQAFSGPQRGYAGRVMRGLGRLSARLYDHPVYLARLLGVDP